MTLGLRHPCRRCGDTWFPVTTVYDGTPLCRDCWRWMGEISDAAAILDTQLWPSPPPIQSVETIRLACKTLLKAERKEQRIKAAERKDHAPKRTHDREPRYERR